MSLKSLRARSNNVAALLVLSAGCSGGSGASSDALVTAPTPVPASGVSAPAASQRIVLRAYDSNGIRIPWSTFRAIEENRKGAGADNDTIVDLANLQVRSKSPLSSSDGSANGDPSLAIPADGQALTLAWPTRDGYSTLVVSLPTAAGTYVFNRLVARQIVRDLDTARAARPWYVEQPEYLAAAALAHAKLEQAASAQTEAQVGATSAEATDAAIHAQLLLLSQSGLQYAAAHRDGSIPIQWGVTFDEISGGQTDLQSVAALVAPRPTDGWIRIVFDRDQAASYYADEIARAHALGLRVLGEILDSYEMKYFDQSAWQERVRSYVSALPNVDEWEIGNEVNGNWLGAGVAEKVAYAADYVKRTTKTRTLLTLYWQLGEDDPSHAMFNWSATNLPDSVRTNIDDVGISLYPENAPMGSAFDRVMTELHATFPTQRVMITELDYWSVDTGRTWWWGSQSDPMGAGRIAVATLYQSAVLSYPYSGGGMFWWYYLEEAKQNTMLWNTLLTLHRQGSGT